MSCRLITVLSTKFCLSHLAMLLFCVVMAINYANASSHLPCLLPWHWQHWLSGGKALLARLAHYSGASSGLAAPPYLKLLKSMKLPAPHTSATVNTPWSFDGLWCLLGALPSSFFDVKSRLSVLSCLWPSTWYPYVPMHPCHPYPTSRGQKTLVCAAARASCKYLDQRQDKACSNQMLPCRFSDAAQQQRGSSIASTVLHYIFYHMIYDISYHWFETHHRSVLILSCFGQALPSHCHASFSWSLFSGSTSRPHSSWKLKSRQDDSAPSTLQESNHVGLDKGMRGGATRHWIISYHMNIEHTVLVFACTGQCFKLEGLEYIIRTNLTIWGYNLHQFAVQSAYITSFFLCLICLPPIWHLTISVLGDLGLRRLPHGWPLDLPLGCRAGGGWRWGLSADSIPRVYRTHPYTNKAGNCITMVYIVVYM